MTGRWIHWECPGCGRTNNAPAVKIELMQELGLDTIALGCAHPGCDGVAALDDVETAVKHERREAWTEGCA